jgi:hypothetical protein
MTELGNGWYRGDDGYLHNRIQDEEIRQYWEDVLASGKPSWFDSQETKDGLEKLVGHQIDVPIKQPGEPPKQIMEFGGFEWRVLEKQAGKALLISRHVLEHRAYHGAQHGTWRHRNMTNKEKEALAITWADCDLRAYLNGEFLERFVESDRARIIETHNENQDNQWHYAEAMASGDDEKIRFAPKGGADTIDKVFLLSIAETVKYFGDSGKLEKRFNYLKTEIDDWFNKERFARCIDTCPYNRDWHANGKYGAGPIWMLRSPGSKSFRVAIIDNYGMIYVGGQPVNGFDEPNMHGVRPALWLEL